MLNAMIDEKPPKKIVKYRAVIANLHEGRYQPLDGIFDSRDAAQEALKAYFDNHKALGMQGDLGGYVEEVNLDLAYEPFESQFVDEE